MVLYFTPAQRIRRRVNENQIRSYGKKKKFAHLSILVRITQRCV